MVLLASDLSVVQTFHHNEAHMATYVTPVFTSNTDFVYSSRHATALRFGLVAVGSPIDIWGTELDCASCVGFDQRVYQTVTYFQDENTIFSAVCLERTATECTIAKMGAVFGDSIVIKKFDYGGTQSPVYGESLRSAYQSTGKVFLMMAFQNGNQNLYEIDTIAYTVLRALSYASTLHFNPHSVFSLKLGKLTIPTRNETTGFFITTTDAATLTPDSILKFTSLTPPALVDDALLVGTSGLILPRLDEAVTSSGDPISSLSDTIPYFRNHQIPTFLLLTTNQI
jgi:hypothetical protein